MEINYNLIIKYLSKKADTFITKNNIFNYANTFPEKFQNLLSDKFYRLGITVYDKNNNNVSFWSSLLTLIDKDFSVSFNNNEGSIINNYKNELLDNFNVSKDNKYKIFTDKTILRDKLNKVPDFELLEYIVTILDINFIIFDFKSFDIYSLYNGNKMNPFKSILLFAKYDNYWEPIMIIKDKVNIQRSFNYNDHNIKKILDSNEILYYDNQKEYSLMTPQDVICVEKTKLCKTDDTIIDEIFVNPNTLNYKTLNKTKLTKMKLEEVKKIIDELTIDIPTVKYTKALLIDLILNKIKD